MHTIVQRGLWPLSVLALATLTACGSGGGDSGSPSTFQAEIRRTTMGVPHIKASNWAGLGYGYGYAQAQDTLCTMADAFLTYRGERSQYLGGEALAVNKTTLGRPKNLDSDFFFRHVVSDDVIDTLSQSMTEDMRKLMGGFMAGYNRYVREAQASTSAHAACRSAPWVKPITERDLLRRAYAANLAAGYSNFVPQIANGAPAVPTQGQPQLQNQPALTPESIVAPDMEVGGKAGVGSNMYGFGPAVTGDSSPVMFGNPHWYWKGGDRFYQAQLTIPGQVNVSGVSFLGLPMIQIGFNDSVAWSHTVSTARRFGLFQLTLAPNDTTSYLVDGQPVKMAVSTVSVVVLDAAGKTSTVQRTMYKTAYGPLVNLASLHPALGSFTFAMRDINAQNFRSLRNWMRWNMAGSLDDFAKIQKEEAAIPWVNTVAVGRGSNQVWYADIGTVPNVPPQQLADCTTPVGQLMAAAVPNVPILDGARSACEWSTDPDSVQKGAIGVARMPSLMRTDYVGNMNDSYWLTNANHPLTGFPAIFGPAGEGATQSLRTRLGHTMALERLAGSDGYAGKQASSSIVRQMVLNNRVFSAERFKTQVLNLVCNSPSADIASACSALAAWDNRGNADSRGSHVWDEFWSSTSATIKDAELYSTPFNPADPLNTPRDINPAALAKLSQAMVGAAQKVQSSGFAFDAPRGELLFSVRGGQKIPLYGGCGGQGYFTIACSENPLNQGGYNMDGQPHGNTYMQVVSFPGNGVEAYTFLTFSLSDDPASPHYADYTKAYAAKDWLRVPFSEAEISADKNLQTVSIRE